MKFVIFSPFGLPSAIGRVTALLVAAMVRQGHTAVVVRTEVEAFIATPTHPCAAPVIDWTNDAAVREAAGSADGLIYQIGNNYNYHCGGLHWLRRLPGIICLHDFLVAHMFAEWAQDHRDEACEILRNWYGEDAPVEFFSPTNQWEFVEIATRHYPMTEWVCSLGSAVVAHSHWGMKRVAASCAGPLRVLPLPYDAPGASSSPQRSLQTERLEILTVGHVNANKRIDSVIRAIGSSDVLAQNVTYRLCGRIEPAMAATLSELATAEAVELVISGEIDDSGLQQAMHRAEVVCCLRWPSFESASATAIEALLYGKALVVTDAAFYGELPDECVRKISPDDEIAELRLALENLLVDREGRVAMAQRGQAWAVRTFEADGYVTQLASLARDTAAAQPILDMTAAFVGYFEGWGATLEIMTAKQIAGPLAIFEGVHPLMSETPPDRLASPAPSDNPSRSS
ncbi:Glycosyltransferase involved in cell wall bisynthesis [Burkholderiales bacterium 8X]|nr:Glycosyltransferase involved in cell wall bisynthesis [Burkholderiales bacterium 8X]